MTAMEQTQDRHEDAIANLQARIERLEGSTH